MSRPLQLGLELGARTLILASGPMGRGSGAAWRCRIQSRTQEHDQPHLVHEIAALLHPFRHGRLRTPLILLAPHSYLRTVTVRVPTLAQLPDALTQELASQLPFEMERAQTAFVVRRQQRVDGQQECTVTVAACERGQLEEDLDALWQAGWVPRRVLPVAEAIVQAAQALGVIDATPTLFMDMGQRRTTIACVEEGRVVYARDVALGVDHVTDALMTQVTIGDKTLALSRDEAQALVREVGIPEGSSPLVGSVQIPVVTYLAMIQPVLEQLVSELRRTMTSGSAGSVAHAPARLVISGESTHLPRYDTWLSAHVALPVVRMACDQWKDQEGASAAVVYGAALCAQGTFLDLHPETSRRRGAIVRVVASLWKALVVAAILVWAATAGRTLQHQRAQLERRALETRWTDAQPVVSLQQQLERYTDVTQRLAQNRSLPLGWFRQLAAELPQSVRLTTLNVSATHAVALEGEAQERDQTAEATISELTVWLAQLRLCRDVQLGSTRRLEAEGNLVAFALTCQLTKP